MRNLAIIRQNYRPDGGGERFVSRAIANLKDNYNISIICRSWDSSSPALPTVTKHIINPTYRNRVERERNFVTDALEFVEKQNFDIVQSHERMPGCTLYRAGDGVHAEWLTQQKPFISPLKRWWLKRDPFHQYMLNAEREMFLHPNLKAVICNSQMVKDEIISHFNVSPEKLHVIHNAVGKKFNKRDAAQYREEIRQTLNIGTHTPTALFVGSGFYRKGLRFAIEAISRVQDLHLIVVGQDKRLNRYKSLAKNLNCETRVRFCGVQNNVLPYYGAADFLLHPAIYEPYANVTIEALSCGLPIVVSNKTGARDVVEGYSCGTIARCNDINSLATGIEIILQDLALFRERAIKASSIFSEERLLASLNTLYKEITSK